MLYQGKIILANIWQGTKNRFQRTNTRKAISKENLPANTGTATVSGAGRGVQRSPHLRGLISSQLLRQHYPGGLGAAWLVCWVFRSVAIRPQEATGKGNKQGAQNAKRGTRRRVNSPLAMFQMAQDSDYTFLGSTIN